MDLNFHLLTGSYAEVAAIRDRYHRVRAARGSVRLRLIGDFPAETMTEIEGAVRGAPPEEFPAIVLGSTPHGIR